MEQDYDVHGRGYWHCPKLDEKKDSADPHGPDTEQRDPATKGKANLLSSLCKDGLHRPVLDIDLPARLVPSSTDGHFHLYIDQGILWEKYAALLQALQDAGILEEGYAQAGIRRGATFVRPPDIKKPAAMLAAPMEYKTSKDLYELRTAARAAGQCGIVLDGRTGDLCRRPYQHGGFCDDPF